MTTLWEAVGGLLGGEAASSLLPGDMPGDPSYGRPPGYDPDEARWAQISRGLLEAGARVASAPRGQATGQGLLGLIEGMDTGREAYENGLGRGDATGIRGGNLAGIGAQYTVKKQSPVRQRADDPVTGATGYFRDPGYQPVLEPGSNGGGHGYDRCALIPELSRIGLCFYLCPDGAIIRGNANGPSGCSAFRFRGQGVGPDSDMV
jgi:hypothetical protein